MLALVPLVQVPVPLLVLVPARVLLLHSPEGLAPAAYGVVVGVCAMWYPPQ